MCWGSSRPSLGSLICQDSKLISFGQRRPSTQLLQQLIVTLVKRCQLGKLIRRPVAGFLLGADTQEPSTWHIPKFQSPRRKAGVHYKPQCLHKQCRHSESLLSANGGENAPKISVPRCPPFAGLSKIAGTFFFFHKVYSLLSLLSYLLVFCHCFWVPSTSKYSSH